MHLEQGVPLQEKEGEVKKPQHVSRKRRQGYDILETSPDDRNLFGSATREFFYGLNRKNVFIGLAVVMCIYFIGHHNGVKSITESNGVVSDKNDEMDPLVDFGEEEDDKFVTIEPKMERGNNDDYYADDEMDLEEQEEQEENASIAHKKNSDKLLPTTHPTEYGIDEMTIEVTNAPIPHTTSSPTTSYPNTISPTTTSPTGVPTGSPITKEPTKSPVDDTSIPTKVQTTEPTEKVEIDEPTGAEVTEAPSNIPTEKEIFTEESTDVEEDTFVPTLAPHEVTDEPIETETPSSSPSEAVIETDMSTSSPSGSAKEESKSDSNGSNVIPKFHSAQFGGLENIMHPAGAKHLKGKDMSHVTIPSHGKIKSLSYQNILNHWGHYVHDEYFSPFSSFLYDRPKKELEAEQADFERKMSKIRKDWGAWSFYDSVENRPEPDFDSVDYRDLDVKKFPQGSWQTDETYINNFLSEGRQLVDRMKKAIYAEYGHTEKDKDLFEVQICSNKESEKKIKSGKGVSWMSQIAFDALVRKLLHAMITNDYFFVVLGGHSAAAGHGNNFVQNKILQFQRIMEPVMGKLGVKLMSRNLAMGGLGTLHFSLGQSTLYGEKDFIIWDSSMTETGLGPRELFSKQALIGGERVPLIFINNIGGLEEETSNTIWNGDVLAGDGIVPSTNNPKQVSSMPWATQFVQCSSQSKDFCEMKEYKYHEKCWEPRTDITPKREQAAHAGSQVGWHPGDKSHQFESRKYAMTILHALSKAFDVWEDGINKDGFPLKEEYWHVGAQYKQIQTNLITYMNGKGKGQSECEKRYSTCGFDKVCRTAMSGMTEWTPKNNPDVNNIYSRLKPDKHGYVPSMDDPVYTGTDVVPLIWKIPENDVDVHAVAIASTYAAPDLDQSWRERDRKLLTELLNDGHSRVTKVFSDQSRSAQQLAQDRLIQTRNLRKKKKSNKTSEKSSGGSGYSSDVVPGSGWGYMNAENSMGFCDGSTTSECGRGSDQKCLMYGHNDHKGILIGDALSGWLVIQMPKMKEGLIIAKMEWWHPRGSEYTKGWTQVNNGERKLLTHEQDEKTVRNRLHRKLGPKEWPKDIEMDIAINDQIVKTWDFDKLVELRTEVTHNQAIYPMIDDQKLAGNDQHVELAIRFRSEKDPTSAGMGLAHIYYA